MPESLFPATAIPPGIRTVYASFSGGADSLALLLSLKSLRDAGAEWTLRAVHFEHGIRGEESLADAAFCRRVCRKLHVPLKTVLLDVPAHLEPGEGVEAAARRLRQTAWRTLAEPGSAVALGHNSDDRIESLFLRLMRGSNLSGLNALHPVRAFQGVVWLRPLLEVPRAEIESYLRRCGATAYRTDSTNLENDYDRNKLRNTVLPVLYREFPRARAGILTAIRAVADDAAALDSMAEDALKQAIRPGHTLDLAALSAMPPALLPRVLRLWLDGQIPDRHLIERLRQLLDHRGSFARQGRITVSGGAVFRWRNDRLHLGESPARRESAEPILWDYRAVPTVRFGHTVLRFRGETCDVSMPSGIESAVFSADASFPDTLLIAPRRPGDAMTPFGASSPVPLKKLFTDARVPSDEQPLRPVIRDGSAPGEILWLPGVRRSSLYPLKKRKGKTPGLLFSAEPLVDVTAAVIGRSDGRILVCSRPAGTHLAGKWEFPGGKIEPGETPEDCIRREIREELAMEIAVGPVLTVMEHDYGVKYVRVTFFAAVSDDFPVAEDGQKFRWVKPEALERVAFLDADRPVAAEIRKKSKKISGIYNKIRAGNVIWVSRQP